MAAMPMSAAEDDSRTVSGQAVLGEWEPPDRDVVISIRQCGDLLCADLVQHDYENLTGTDINNPDPVMRTRLLYGVRILDGLRPINNNFWKGGKLYDPRTGKTYFSKLKIIDYNHLKITGCVGPALCKGYIWTRVVPKKARFDQHSSSLP